MSNSEEEILKKLERIEKVSEKIHLQLISIEQKLTVLEEELERKIQRKIFQTFEEMKVVATFPQNTD